MSPRRRRIVALLVLGTLASAGAWALSLRTPPATVFDIGAGDDVRARMQAHWFEYVLVHALGESEVQLAVDERLRLAVRGTGDLIDPDRPLGGQIGRLLEARWRQPSSGEPRPATRAAFEARHGVDDWPCETLERSLAKPVPRRICRHPEGTAALAYTLAADGDVRETEVAVARDGGDDHDFFVYGSDGRLSRHADFGDHGSPRWLPAPESCAGCHYDHRREVFARRPVFAAGTGGESLRPDRRADPTTELP